MPRARRKVRPLVFLSHRQHEQQQQQDAAVLRAFAVG